MAFQLQFHPSAPLIPVPYHQEVIINDAWEILLVISKKTRRIEGNVEKIGLGDRLLHLRFGKEPGEYLILYVPRNCFIHRLDGERLPLRDVQYCDNVSVWFQKHPRFPIQLAQEIEVC